MSLRPPQFFTRSTRFETGLSVYDGQILEEQAAALGRLGASAAKAMTALNADGTARDSPEREALVRAAAKAVWQFFIQREVCGMTNHDGAIAQYRIPREVLIRLGAMD